MAVSLLALIIRLINTIYMPPHSMNIKTKMVTSTRKFLFFISFITSQVVIYF